MVSCSAIALLLLQRNMTSRILDDVLLNMTSEQSIHLKKDTDLRKAGHRFGTSMTSVDTDLWKGHRFETGHGFESYIYKYIWIIEMEHIFMACQYSWKLHQTWCPNSSWTAHESWYGFTTKIPYQTWGPILIYKKNPYWPSYQPWGHNNQINICSILDMQKRIYLD